MQKNSKVLFAELAALIEDVAHMQVGISSIEEDLTQAEKEKARSLKALSDGKNAAKKAIDEAEKADKTMGEAAEAYEAAAKVLKVAEEAKTKAIQEAEKAAAEAEAKVNAIDGLIEASLLANERYVLAEAAKNVAQAEKATAERRIQLLEQNARSAIRKEAEGNSIPAPVVENKTFLGLDWSNPFKKN